MKIGIVVIIVFLPMLIFCQNFDFTFEENNQGWVGFFSDYEVGEEEGYELEFLHYNLPFPLDTTKGSLKISGNNHSDDLLMCIYKKFDGLLSNSYYAVSFDINIASNAEKGGFGIGGSPDLMLGAGGINYFPDNTIDYLSHYRPNFNSLIQAELPNDILDTIGRIGVTGSHPIDFQLINRNNLSDPIMLQTNSNGEIWILILIDSSFEGITTLYYDNIKVTFELSTGLDMKYKHDLIILFPNPTNDILHISNLDYCKISYIKIINNIGEILYSGKVNSNEFILNISNYKTGLYFINIEYKTGNIVSKKVILN